MSSQSIVRALKKQGKPGISYEWSKGSPQVAPIEVAMGEFRRIAEEYGGIDPGVLVYESKPKTAVFHSAFTWDDKEAADRHREEEARWLVRNVVVVHRDARGQATTAPVRAFVIVAKEDDITPLEDIPEHGWEGRRVPHHYVPVIDVMSQEEMRRKHVQRAFEEFQSWKRRYEDVAEFAAIFEEMERLAQQLDVAS